MDVSHNCKLMISPYQEFKNIRTNVYNSTFFRVYENVNRSVNDVLYNRRDVYVRTESFSLFNSITAVVSRKMYEYELSK